MFLSSRHFFSYLLLTLSRLLLPWPGGKAVAFVLYGLEFESWPDLVFFFSIKENVKEKSQKNEKLVFRLFAQDLSSKLPQNGLCLFLVVESANVVHSNFKGDLEDLKKIIIKFFFGLVDVCSKMVDLVASSLIFFAEGKFHCSCKCKCCSFQFEEGIERF